MTPDLLTTAVAVLTGWADLVEDLLWQNTVLRAERDEARAALRTLVPVPGRPICRTCGHPFVSTKRKAHVCEPCRAASKVASQRKFYLKSRQDAGHVVRRRADDPVEGE